MATKPKSPTTQTPNTTSGTKVKNTSNKTTAQKEVEEANPFEVKERSDGDKLRDFTRGVKDTSYSLNSCLFQITHCISVLTALRIALNGPLSVEEVNSLSPTCDAAEELLRALDAEIRIIDDKLNGLVDHYGV